MGSLSIWHWIIVLIVVLLVFGTKKLRHLGEDLGGAIKGFKDGMRDADTSSPSIEAKPKTESEHESPPSHADRRSER